jgi:hypothetical protein
MITLARPELPKALLPMLVTLLGMVTLVRLAQPEKAPPPMLVTLSGMVTLVRPDPAKALYPMAVTCTLFMRGGIRTAVLEPIYLVIPSILNIKIAFGIILLDARAHRHCRDEGKSKKRFFAFHRKLLVCEYKKAGPPQGSSGIFAGEGLLRKEWAARYLTRFLLYRV